MTCKVCGSEVSADATFCFDCGDEWGRSLEYQRWRDARTPPEAQACAVVDFITRLRLERLNGAKP
jgi:hypothetical protein